MQKPDNSNNVPIFDNIDINTYINEVISFIETKLCLFPEFLKSSSILQQLSDTISGEDKITENLCSFFTRQEKEYTYQIEKQDNYDFQFINQAKGKGHRSYDTGVILANTKNCSEKILTMEAKRLPTPGSGREREYVLGNLGGIERFKKEVHAQEIKSNLAIMIGYVQKENSDHWCEKINEWITEQIMISSNPNISWFAEDLLIEDENFNQEKICKYNSGHSRIRLEKIKIHHYWIDLN